MEKIFSKPVRFGVIVIGIVLVMQAVGGISAVSSYSCSIEQGFNFKKDSNETVGFINTLKIADTDIPADLNVTNPENTAQSMKVVGVASSIYWNGGYADPVQFGAQVTTDNKNKLATLPHKTLSNAGVEFMFTIYDYDRVAKVYYKCFQTNGIKLKGLIFKQGGELVFKITDEASSEVPSPKNYALSLGVMPQNLAQEIHIAASKTNKWVKPWGVAVAP